VPALDWLLKQPRNVQDTLLAIVQGVRASGPDSWFDQTHIPMSGPVAHLHEARDKLDQTLYRLFLLWQRDERRVVFIDDAPSQTTRRCTLPSTRRSPRWQSTPTTIGRS
jgi:hypothetical protein